MPNYSYTCPKCKWTGEKYKPIADRNKARCPRCRSKLKIDFSRIGIRNVTGLYDPYPLTISDLGPRPSDVHTVHSKYEHKEVLKKYDKECPGLMK